jgi:hypothetical protein
MNSSRRAMFPATGAATGDESTLRAAQRILSPKKTSAQTPGAHWSTYARTLARSRCCPTRSYSLGQRPCVSRMSPSASLVGLECMATADTTRTPSADRASARVRRDKNTSSAGTRRDPTATESTHDDDRAAAAANAVAAAFARILAERYPGTSWLPIESPRSEHRLVVPAGKVIRLVPGPADMDRSNGIGQAGHAPRA